MKMATKVGMYPATHESVAVASGRDRKIRAALRINQICNIRSRALWKKINGYIKSSFFSEPFLIFFQQYVKANESIKNQVVVGFLTKVNPCTIMQNVSAILLLQYTSALSFY